MDWPQHIWTVESSRCISGGPCHPHGEAWEILIVGQWHHSYQGHMSVQAREQGVEGGAEKALSTPGKGWCTSGNKAEIGLRFFCKERGRIFLN